jgi:hypothetical protein
MWRPDGLALFYNFATRNDLCFRAELLSWLPRYSMTIRAPIHFS